MALKLNAPENFGLRQVDILEAQGDASASIERYLAWCNARDRVLEKGQAAHFEIVPATGMTETPPRRADSDHHRIGNEGNKRPGGVRFGELFHGILRDADLAASRESIARLAAIHGKVIGASSEEIEAAVEAAMAALSRIRSFSRPPRHRAVIAKCRCCFPLVTAAVSKA